MSVIVYDTEIKKAIQGRNEERLQGIEYCDGWRDFENMGISCLCAHDMASERQHVFLDDNLQLFSDLLDGTDIVVTFNGIGFDNRLLAANGIVVPPEKNYDILAEAWTADGLDPTQFDFRTHGGYGLDALASANGIGKKSGHGATAPVWYQQGKIGQLISYCLDDVMLTVELFRRIARGEALKHPKRVGELFSLRRP
mgnify:CR=1 FL=1|jgi:hypothetical protein